MRSNGNAGPQQKYLPQQKHQPDSLFPPGQMVYMHGDLLSIAIDGRSGGKAEKD